MDSNPYAAPDSPLAAEPAVESQAFYVVSPLKFFLLFGATLGIYQLYWHYKNWALYKKAHHGDQWPIARAIFAIFFTHDLFQEVDQQLKKNGSTYSWRHHLHATAIVLLLIADRILGRLSEINEDFTALDVLTILTIPLIGIFYYRAQKAINHACGDPDGLTNSNFTIANILWISLGGLFVLLIIASVILIMMTEV